MNIWRKMARIRPIALGEDSRNSFQRSLCPLLVAGQFFGLMPVSGLTGHDASSLKFKLFSFRVVYSCMSLVGISVFFTLQTWDLAVTPSITYSSCAGTVFFAITLIATYMFLRLAVKWPAFVSTWEDVEKEMVADYGYPKNLARKCKISSALLLSASTAEHIMAIYSEFRRAAPCSQGGLDFLRVFYMLWFGSTFKHTSYALWKAILMQLSNSLATFTWSYMDMFVTLICMALVAKFNQINQRLQVMRGKAAPCGQWRHIRQHYDKLCGLTQTVEDHISHLVLLCIVNDLYFVCLQLFNSLENVQSLYEYIFFYYSFGYLLIRACVMCLSAAAINEASKVPKDILYCVPSDGYNEEVERFIDQVTTGHVVLTGFRFIDINKSFLLTVIGSIATYELLLVQQNIGGNKFPTLSRNATDTAFVCP